MTTTRLSTIEFSIGPGLSFRFDPVSELLRHRIETALAYHLGVDVDDGGDPIVVGAQRPDETALAKSEIIIEEPPLTVRRHGSSVFFDLPGVLSWADASRGLGGICADPDVKASLESWSHLVLAPLLIELASTKGWIGLHAAAIARSQRCVVLPGPSGAGKSTLFRDAATSAWDVLSDDLVWARQSDDGWRIHAFPKTHREPATPEPSTDNVPLSAIVFPEIERHPDHQLLELDAPETMVRLVRQTAFLTLGTEGGKRFEALISMVSSVPAYRLIAGSSDTTATELLTPLVVR